jgi:hypothetical protein
MLPGRPVHLHQVLEKITLNKSELHEFGIVDQFVTG